LSYPRSRLVWATCSFGVSPKGTVVKKFAAGMAAADRVEHLERRHHLACRGVSPRLRLEFR
jgi:hypothetical protein